MSPSLHIQLARFHRDEIAARAHHAHELRAAAGRPPRTVRHRVSQAVAGFVVGLAVATVTVSGAHASPRPAKAARPSQRHSCPATSAPSKPRG